jgi:hypothetical protein
MSTFLFAELGIELRALCLLGKYSEMATVVCENWPLLRLLASTPQNPATHHTPVPQKPGKGHELQMWIQKLVILLLIKIRPCVKSLALLFLKI